ncbi:glycoside hydrolase family 95 protein [Auriculariales sp. MPI-PUGE-AT-0066]|nr:glycoside hydrolase family 95 protein [Auriculariales sp. MPI-PUGE-AT-0066]
MAQSLRKAGQCCRSRKYLGGISPNSLAPTAAASPGNRLWYRTWAEDWFLDYLPVGNGYQGQMQSSRPDWDDVQLNLESLWSGGPFVNATYSGGNPATAVTQAALDNIRATVWKNETANLLPLVDASYYGSLSSAGSLHLSRTLSSNVSSYTRSLDLGRGLVNATWSEGAVSYSRTYFCSYPDKACVVDTTASSTPSDGTVYYFDTLRTADIASVTCFDDHTLLYRGQAEAGGMAYEILARILSNGPVQCSESSSPGNATLVATGARQTLIWTGETEYNIDAGTPAQRFSFKGPDPHAAALKSLSAATKSGLARLLANHLRDYTTLYDAFALDLGQEIDKERTTDELVQAYSMDEGNVYLEWLVFNLGRFFTISGNRGVLPPGLQAVWTTGLAAPWSGDYHWGVQETALGSTTTPLWNYMQKTWMPRGSETARLLYGSRGFVTHNEMNIFGHTGMKLWDDPGTPQWANYPAAAAWMMQHVWDEFDFGGDISWFRRQGWPLLKGVALFWLDNLFTDEATGDGTLVVNPCNSPENPRCSHWQQQIWDVFHNVLKGWPLSGDSDVAFIAEVKGTLSKLDRGIRIGSWGQLQEWKLDLDSPTDMHRHISHLIGLAPGYAIASYNGTSPSRQEVLAAAATSLVHRGPGIVDDDPGWAKMHRSLVYAQLANATGALYEYRLAISRDFQTNLFDMYAGKSTRLFQADANYGAVGAVMNMIVQADNTPAGDDVLVIRLIPAIPTAWANGSVRNARVRNGIGITMSWKQGKVVSAALAFDHSGLRKNIQVIGNGRILKTLRAPSSGTVRVV